MSSFGSGEPAVWTEQDAEYALAWQARQAVACSNCGTRREEWDKDRFAYVAHQQYCPGCEVLHQAQRDVREEIRPFVHIGLIPRELADDG